MPAAIRERSLSSIRKQVLQARHYFQLLGVHRNSTPLALTIARRDLAAVVHPDVCNTKDATEMMACVNQAFEVLADEKQKARYIVELNLKPCTACKSRGYLSKQKGFNKIVETTCAVCAGAGVV